MGPPRKSEKRKRLEGTDQPCRRRRPTPGERLSRTPAPPSYLSEGAREEWRSLAPLARRLGTLTACDLRAFGLLCETLATETAAREAVGRDGLTTGTDAGGIKRSPVVGVMERARAQAARLLCEFGLTPRGRGQIDPAPELKPNDGWDDLERGG